MRFYNKDFSFKYLRRRFRKCDVKKFRISLGAYLLSERIKNENYASSIN